MGHKPGDKLTYEAPNGKTIEVEILECVPYGQEG